MPSTRFLLTLAAVAAASFSAAAQVARPPRADAPPVVPFGLDAAPRGARACQKSHLASEAAQQAGLARRVASGSRSHERLMNRYDVTFAHLDIALDKAATTLGAGSNVRTQARNRPGAGSLDTIGFELHPSLTLDSARVNGVRVPTTRIQRLTSGNVRLRPLTPVAPGAAFEYQVWYHGTPTPTGAAAIGDGITTAASPSWGNQVTWTLSQPFSAYEWWPCKQTLSDKLDSVAVWITTSAVNKAGSNGVLEAVTPRPGGKMRYEWKSRYPIDYYLVSAAVAQYIDYTIYAHPAGMPAGDSLPVVNYVYDNPQTLIRWQDDIDATAPMIENYSAKVGLYPFWREKYGHSMAPVGGGMEHQTMTTQGNFEFTLTAHELFHQWFGDNVTCRSWRDIWLNEGFASYGEYISLAALQPADAPTWLNDMRQAAFAQLSGSVAVPDTLSNNRIFDYGLTYQKGSALVRMLRYVAGSDSVFYAGLRAYQTQYSGSVASTADFQHSLETAWNRPANSLSWFFNQWFAGEGFPRIDAAWNQVGSQVVVENVESVTAASVTPFFRLPVDVRVVFTSGAISPITYRVDQTLATQRWTLAVPAGATVQRIEIDPDHWNLVQVLRVRRLTSLQPTGLADELATAPLLVYPNPSADVVYVAPISADRTADILDLAGRRVLRQTLAARAEVLDTRPLAPGTYLLRLTAADGTSRQTRFVKKG